MKNLRIVMHSRVLTALDNNLQGLGTAVGSSGHNRIDHFCNISAFAHARDNCHNIITVDYFHQITHCIAAAFQCFVSGKAASLSQCLCLA